MTDEAFWEYARQRAHLVPEAPSYTEYIECKLSNKTCMISLRDLMEVLSPPHRMARLPDMPIWMTGIMAWRGEIIAVANLDRYLWHTNETNTSWTANGIVVVLCQNTEVLGLLIPELGLTSTIEAEEIVPLADNSLLALACGEGADIIAGLYKDSPVLNAPSLLKNLIQEIGAAAYHG